MKLFCSSVALVVLTAGCASKWPPANNQTAQQIPAQKNTYVPRGNHGATRGDSVSKPPVLSVGGYTMAEVWHSCSIAHQRREKCSP